MDKYQILQNVSKLPLKDRRVALKNLGLFSGTAPKSSKRRKMSASKLLKSRARKRHKKINIDQMDF